MAKNKIITKIIEIRNISKSLYFLILERQNIDFESGQHITLRIPGEDKSRLYSIASGKFDKSLKVLIRQISNGDLSKRFRELEINSYLEITEPVGYFCLPLDLKSKNVICIATGSGIAPFISYSNTYPFYNFTIIHGIRNLEDSFKNEISDNVNYITCTTKSVDGAYHGRVTEYIKANPIDSDSLYYLCGNGEMIHEIYSYLRKNNISRDCIFYEEYFNN